MGKQILQALNQRPVAYYPIYAEITGSVTAGILLSQLMYWFAKKDKIYKTNNEMQEEIHFTDKQFKNAKQKVNQLPFIHITKEGIPAKTYYEIDWDGYEKALEKGGPTCRSQKGPTVWSQKGPTV